MQQMWINIIVICFLAYESISDIFTRKISIVEGMPLLIGGIVYNIILKINPAGWIYGFLFSILVCGFSYISKGQIGLGDGIILIILSPLLREKIISIFIYALFLCAMTGIIWGLCQGISRKQRLPLVPFMTLAFLLEILV